MNATQIKKTCNCGVGETSRAAHNFDCPKRIYTKKVLLRMKREKKRT